jgi:hypothetical protein
LGIAAFKSFLLQKANQAKSISQELSFFLKEFKNYIIISIEKL